MMTLISAFTILESGLEKVDELLMTESSSERRVDLLKEFGSTLTSHMSLSETPIAVVIRPEDADSIGAGVTEFLSGNRAKYGLAFLWLDYVDFGDQLVRPRHLIRKQYIQPIEGVAQVLIVLSILDDPEPAMTMWHRVRSRFGNADVSVLSATAINGAESRLREAMAEAGVALREIRLGLLLHPTEEQKEMLPKELSRGFNPSARRAAVPQVLKDILSNLDSSFDASAPKI